MTEEPQFTNWQDAWEWHAQQTKDYFSQLSEDEMLALIDAGRYDAYYQVWYNLREVGTLKKCAPVLVEVLRREAGESMMLVRYHCAAALFHLMGYPDDPMPELRQRVQWDHKGEEARQQAIEELQKVIEDSTNSEQ